MEDQIENSNPLKPLPKWGRRHNSDFQTDSPWAHKVILSLGMEYHGLEAYLHSSHADMVIIYRWGRSQRLLFFTHLEALDGRN
jgi:hypothetical protein